MNNRRTIARKAVMAALWTRRAVGYGLDHAICVYDLAEKLGVEVRFLNLPSMEGMYLSASCPTIIISSLRPSGRRAFTCAHELGHHKWGEGVEIDEILEQWDKPRLDPNEFKADCFAGALLMPKMAVSRAFAVRGWRMEVCTPAQIFLIASYFGVGYTTLIQHMQSALQVLPGERAQALLKVGPRKAQSQLLGLQTQHKVVEVDAHWTGKAVDVEVGDFIFLRGGAQSEGACIEPWSDVEHGRLFRAARPGIGRLVASTSCPAFVRVSRRDYVGRSLYRHWEEADDE